MPDPETLDPKTLKTLETEKRSKSVDIGHNQTVVHHVIGPLVQSQEQKELRRDIKSTKNLPTDIMPEEQEHLIGIGADDMVDYTPAVLTTTVYNASIRNYGQPIPTPEEYAEGHETVHFDWDEYAIRPEDAAKLDQVAAYLVAHPTARIDITGHTDSSGNDAYNMRLSENRLNAVCAYLQNKGVPFLQMNDGAGQVATDFKGEKDLLVNTGDGVRLEENRRVEIKFVYDDPALQHRVIHNYYFNEESGDNRQFNAALRTPGPYINGRANFVFDEKITSPKHVSVDANNIYEQGFYILCDGEKQSVSALYSQKTQELLLLSNANDKISVQQPIAVIQLQSTDPIDPLRLKLSAIDMEGHEIPFNLQQDKSVFSAKIDLQTHGFVPHSQAQNRQNQTTNVPKTTMNGKLN